MLSTLTPAVAYSKRTSSELWCSCEKLYDLNMKKYYLVIYGSWRGATGNSDSVFLLEGIYIKDRTEES